MIHLSNKLSLIFNTEDQIKFFLEAVRCTLDALHAHEYSKFDGHTVSNCCHGMGLLVAELIENYKSSNEDKKSINYQSLSEIPEYLFNLTCLYLISRAVEYRDSGSSGLKTDSTKLQNIRPAGVNFLRKLVKEIQKLVANYVAQQYERYLYDNDSNISEIPFKTWHKYVGNEFIKSDFRGVKYAPCLYSMQIALSVISEKKMHLVLVNKCITQEGAPLEFFLYKGNGIGKFEAIDTSQITELSRDEPVFIFFGVSKSLLKEIEEFSFYLSNISELIFTCDVFYPEYPLVKDDPNFDSSRINPAEKNLIEKIKKTRSKKGFSQDNPKYFCLTHVFLGSIGEIRSGELKQKLNCYLNYT